MYPVRPGTLFLFVFLTSVSTVQAGWKDWLEVLKEPGSDEQAAGPETGTLALSQTEMVGALKEALDRGVDHAIRQLGRPGGFLGDARVRIPLPDQLSWAEKSLRTLGQDKLADDFVRSMNQAAEQAVPEVASVFADAIHDMTLEDARGILQGPDDAATQYFRSHSSSALVQRMRPIVSRATGAAGVTSYYKSMMNKAGDFSRLLGQESVDLDTYVTQKAMDGLFLMIAEQEQQIRENPLQRSSELLKKVFGSFHD